MIILAATTAMAGQIGWVSILIFGFPIVMVLLGEVIRHLQRRRHTALAALRILRNWVIPFLTLFLLLSRVIGYSRATVQVRSAETLLWISLIYGALTLLNSILFEDASVGSWQAKVPQLFRDLGRFVLVLVGSSIVLSTVWGADLGGFLTALGVGSLVLGLALQDSLGNIFSGVALLFEQPIRLGDWVDVNGKVGKVVEVNWRAVHLLTSNDDLVVVPNSELGKTSFVNMSRPVEGYVASIEICFSLDDPPNRVKEVLQKTALELEGVLPSPAPSAEVVRFAEGFIRYSLSFSCRAYGDASRLADSLMGRLWYVARREGLTIPHPTQVSVPFHAYPASTPSAIQEICLRGLRNSCFAALPLPDLQRLVAVSRLREYGAQEVVLYQGTPLNSLHLIVDGEAEILAASEDGSLLTVGILGQGECFGEAVTRLHNRFSETTVRAVSDLRVLVVDQKHLQSCIEVNPRIGKDLASVIDIRRRALEALNHDSFVATTHAQELL